MRRSQITAQFSADIKTVWGIVTNNNDTSWRSDLKEVLTSQDGRHFTEITCRGYKTDFIITEKLPYERYSFQMENKHFTGRWTGVFSITPQGTASVDFTEIIYFKNPVMKALSYLLMYLKKMQETYVRDLQAKLTQ